MADQGVKFEFFGHTYYLRSGEDDVPMQEIVDYVQQVVKDQEQQHQGLPPHKLMVLSVLTIGKDCLSLKRKLEKVENNISEKARDIAKRIDSIVEIKEKKY